MSIDMQAIQALFESAQSQGRSSLFEPECYHMLSSMGAERAPNHVLVRSHIRPKQADLDVIPGDRLVLKVVSPDIIHKTEARGIRFVAKDLSAVEAAIDEMLLDVPKAFAAYLDTQNGHRPTALSDLVGDDLIDRISERIIGIMLCSFTESDARGFATELFIGIRATDEFGPIISAGLGGVEMELLAKETRKGSALAIAPTGTTSGTRFFELFKQTLSYQRLSGLMRGSSQLVDDAALIECFQAFIDVANHFSDVNPDASFHIHEMEVNPFSVAAKRIAPLDGVCSFAPPSLPAGPRPLAKIGSLLKPQSAAIIGVSERSMNMGRIILNNLIKAGFDKERTYIIRPNVEEIDGVRCVESIAALPEKVDLFVVAVGAPQVPEVTSNLIEYDRANAVILIPGGLGEKEGSQDLERELKKRISDAHLEGDGGPVFLGGNSLGVISHPGRYDTMFIPETKLPKSTGENQRRTCFLSQSGAFIITNLSRIPMIDPAYALSMGNQIDLTASDLLRYITDDPEIDVFAVYMEGFQRADGLRFAEATAEAVRRGKDVVFYKAGRTSEGRGATAGHTASVAGDYAVCEAALVQAGAHVAANFNEFGDLAKLAISLRGKRFSGRRLAIMSNAGFESVGMADAIQLDRARLDIVPFVGPSGAELQETLTRHRLDGLVDVKNPLDVTPMATDAAYGDIVTTMLAMDTVDLAVVGIVPLTPALQTLPDGTVTHESIEAAESVANILPKAGAASTTPLVTVVDSGKLYDPLSEHLQSRGLPVFRNADQAVRVLTKFVDTKLRNQASNVARSVS
ncbi:MAG: CoA-binding protein [bacterium]|nr:CoA-binding protein [bacterium]